MSAFTNKLIAHQTGRRAEKMAARAGLPRQESQQVRREVEQERLTSLKDWDREHPRRGRK